MLLLDAFLSFAHFIFVFIMIAALAAEAWVMRLAPRAETIALLARIDAFYGASAGLVIAAGFLRVFYGVNPEDYYWAQPFFWAKIAVFALIGLISVFPTLRFLKWARAAKQDQAFLPLDSEWKGARRWVMIELHLMALIPLFAAFMARAMPPFQ